MDIATIVICHYKHGASEQQWRALAMWAFYVFFMYATPSCMFIFFCYSICLLFCEKESIFLLHCCCCCFTASWPLCLLSKNIYLYLCVCPWIKTTTATEVATRPHIPMLFSVWFYNFLLFCFFFIHNLDIYVCTKE